MISLTIRLLTAFLAGACLSTAGLQMMRLFKNDLADPYCLGIGSGACLGAAIAAILFPAVVFGMLLGSFIGAFFVAALILLIARNTKETSILIIVGMTIGFLASAAISFIGIHADATKLKDYFVWTTGSFQATNPLTLIIFAGVMLFGCLKTVSNSKQFNYLLFGEEHAQMNKVSITKLQYSSLLSASLLTAITAALRGPIQFVGLVAPNIAKRISKKQDFYSVYKMSYLLGGGMTVLADIVVMLTNNLFPVSTIMTFMSIPVVLFIVFRHERINNNN
jgi:iron complex transport system permease protein